MKCTADYRYLHCLVVRASVSYSKIVYGMLCYKRVCRGHLLNVPYDRDAIGDIP
jgi:hypothetical protein